MITIEETFKIKRKGKNQRGYSYAFNCKKCNKIIDCPKSRLIFHTGFCRICLQSKRPYEHLYTVLLQNSLKKGREVNLTYEEFLEFTSINRCHYCEIKIFWNPNTKRNGSNSKSYNLDRKDTTKHYSKENCVVCCYDCNWMKGSLYTYNEFMLLSEGLKQIKRNRTNEQK